MSGCCYVGLTKRPFPVRLAAHVSQARRDTRCRSGGLLEAMRHEQSQGRSFEEAFTARVVCRARTAAEAVEAERQWIAMLSCASPDGYNLMPAGGVGGPANARRIAVEVAPDTREVYRSIHDAIGVRNQRLRAARKAMIDPCRVYARMSAGWSAEKALEYRPHQDGRTKREPFIMNGKVYTSLRDAAAESGMRAAALRARLNRAQADGAAGVPLDISEDRRRRGTGEHEPLGLVWPDTGEVLTTAEMSERTGVPGATVIYGWHSIRNAEARRVGRGLPPYSAAEVLTLLQQRVERRKQITLVLPTGETWHGGERELIRRLQAHPEISGLRKDQVGESGIRRRLRRLSQKQRKTPEWIRHAFGFASPVALETASLVVPLIKGPRRNRLAPPPPPPTVIVTSSPSVPAPASVSILASALAASSTLTPVPEAGR